VRNQDEQQASAAAATAIWASSTLQLELIRVTNVSRICGTRRKREDISGHEGGRN